jgi:alpha-beta hydrolase superfamily lysophospholipase
MTYKRRGFICMSVITWTPEQLSVQSKPLDLEHLKPLSGTQKKYLAFYGIDFFNIYDQLDQSVSFVRVGEYDISTHIFKQAGATQTALLVHGYYDHVGLYGSLIDFCLKQKWNVVAFDLPGHGLSSGNKVEINDFQDYDQVLSFFVDRITSDLDTRLHVFGQSTGGAIIMNYLLTRQLSKESSPFTYIGLLAPLVKPVGYRKAKVIHACIRLVVRYVKRTFSDNTRNLNFRDFLMNEDPLQHKKLSVKWVGALKKWIKQIEQKKTIDVPVVVIQGDDDSTVDWQYNVPFIQKTFSQCRIRMMKGGRHQLVNESEAGKKELYQMLSEEFGLIK